MYFKYLNYKFCLFFFSKRNIVYKQILKTNIKTDKNETKYTKSFKKFSLGRNVRFKTL